MKKFLAAVAIAALGSAATAQTVLPQPEVTQSKPRFVAGTGFGSMGNGEVIVATLLLLVVIGAMAGGDGDNSSTTIFR